MIEASRAQRGAASEWRVRFGFNAMVDFCIWVLETDGLRVPPFDRHDEGPGLLRTMGVEPQTWRAWLHATVAQQAEREDLHAALSRSRRSYPQALEPSLPPCTPRRFNPPLLWPGHPNLQPWLAELWEQYGPIALERRGRTEVLECTMVERWLQETLCDLQPRPGRLHLHLVRYPGVVAYPVPPDAVILGIDTCLADHAALWDAVREVLPALTVTE